MKRVKSLNCYQDNSTKQKVYNTATGETFLWLVLQHMLPRRFDIRVAHYPSYCSKYNDAYFPTSVEPVWVCYLIPFDTVVVLMRKATTTGFKTMVNVIRYQYNTGRNATEEIKRNLRIVFNDVLPKWNYRATPSMQQ